MNAAPRNDEARWQAGNVAQQTTLSRNSSTKKRLPAYGRDLIELQRSGRNVPFLVISIGWNFGTARPRVVIPDDADTSTLDLFFVRGLDCIAAHGGESVRAFDVAELALMYGANRCPVFDMSIGRLEATTTEVLLARGKVAA